MPQIALHRNRAVVLFHDLLCNHEPQSRPLVLFFIRVFNLIELAEYIPLIFFGYADTGIFYTYQYPFSIMDALLDLYGKHLRFSRNDIGLKGDEAAVRREFSRV